MSDHTPVKPLKSEFCFLHEDSDGTETIVKFDQIFTDKIIENFIQFLRGCGHHDICIYTALQFFAEEYFDSMASMNLVEICGDKKEMLKDLRKKKKKGVKQEADDLN